MKLAPRTTLPDVTVPKVGGGELSLPGDLGHSHGVVLVYRGAWCPYCNGQLRAFARSHDALTEAGIAVVALSVDDEAMATELAERLRLPFPVGHSADADAVSATWGSYVNDEPRFLQSTGFVLGPEGEVLTAVYSSGAIGRLVPEDVIGLVNHLKGAS